MFTKFKKTRSTIVAGVTVKLTGTLGSRPSLKLLIVPKWPLCLQRDQVELALLPKILIDLYHIRRTFKPYYATDTDNAPNYIVSMIFEADEIQGNLVLSTKLIILITLSLNDWPLERV